MAKVIEDCGTPISKTQKMIYPIKEQKVDQWTYDYRPNSGFTQGKIIGQKNALVINFSDKKILNIYVLNKEVKQTNYCNPKVSISIGDSMQQVGQVCYYPSSTKNTTLKTVLPRVNQITLTIQPAAGIPAQKLYFVDDKLIKIGD